MQETLMRTVHFDSHVTATHKVLMAHFFLPIMHRVHEISLAGLV